MAGAGIAKANPLKTAVESTKLAIAAFLVPYFFVYSPSLLLLGNVPWTHTLRVVGGALLGMLGLGAGVEAWLITNTTGIERLLLLVGGLSLIHPSVTTDVIGLVFIGAVYFMQKVRVARKRPETIASA